MKLGFIKPNFPGEKRVALLPCDVHNFPNEIVIEEGFGENVDVTDEQYRDVGCQIENRAWIFQNCEGIFSLKLIQPSDYKKLRKNQIVVGWTHPLGSGKNFFEKVCKPLNIKVIDLDNIHPCVFFHEKTQSIDWIPRNFVSKNSFIAGYAATYHALLSFGLMIHADTKVAILSSGNVSQGAFTCIAQLGAQPQLFYRKTMSEFYQDIEKFDIIISGIEMDDTSEHIIDKKHVQRIKKGALIIDAAADAGHTIVGTHLTVISDPLYEKDGIYYYVVANTPSLLFRESSKEISKAFSKYVYCHSLEEFDSIEL